MCFFTNCTRLVRRGTHRSRSISRRQDFLVWAVFFNLWAFQFLKKYWKRTREKRFTLASWTSVFSPLDIFFVLYVSTFYVSSYVLEFRMVWRSTLSGEAIGQTISGPAHHHFPTRVPIISNPWRVNCSPSKVCANNSVSLRHYNSNLISFFPRRVGGGGWVRTFQLLGSSNAQINNNDGLLLWCNKFEGGLSNAARLRDLITTVLRVDTCYAVTIVKTYFFVMGSEGPEKMPPPFIS